MTRVCFFSFAQQTKTKPFWHPVLKSPGASGRLVFSKQPEKVISEFLSFPPLCVAVPKANAISCPRGSSLSSQKETGGGESQAEP